MKTLGEYNIATLEAKLAGRGIKPAHAVTILRAFYEEAGTVDWEKLAIERRGRAFLEREIPHEQSRVISRYKSADGTIKLLIEMPRGGAVEAVLMPGYRPDRAAGCLSSQVGCAMGCDFCASTRGGLERNLEAVEIVEQFLRLKREAQALGRRLTSVVFMGMGEPMHNPDNVIEAIRRFAEPRTGGIGWRQVTVSTVGIVPGIDALAEADLNVHLAVSLHAADDETRERIVPVSRRWPVDEVMAAADRFYQRTRRVLSIEWCMLADVNDSEEQAMKLAALVRGHGRERRMHVNLIPYNSIGTGLSGMVYTRPTKQTMQRFALVLKAQGVVAHFRDTRGDDVNAACGQLRREMVRASEPTCAGGHLR